MGEKETMSGEALRESPTKVSTGGTTVGGLVPGGAILSAAVSSVGQLGGQTHGGGAAAASYARSGRESSAPSVSEGVTAPRDVATGQSSGKTMAHDDWQTQDTAAAGGPGDGEAIPGKPTKEQRSQDATADVDGDTRVTPAAGAYHIPQVEDE